MWQKHNMDPEVFIALSSRKRAYLIASEIINEENKPKPKK
jgi:hypothetical protein